MARFGIVGVTSWLVGLLRIANILFGVAAVGLLVATFGWHDALAERLTTKYGAGFGFETVIWQVRGLGVIGLLATAALAVLLRNLGAVLATLRAGEPFAEANARRLTVIAWMLLCWQLLELAVGVLSYFIVRAGAEAMPWVPSIGGWLSVLVAFVLARVFAAGSRMRDELASTI